MNQSATHDSNTVRKHKRPHKPKPIACALCYGPLGDNERVMHDKHRGTELGAKYLDSLDKPVIRPPREIKHKGGRPPAVRKTAGLTVSELLIVRLMIRGYATATIAEELKVSVSALSARITKIKHKTKSETLYQMVAFVTAKLIETGELNMAEIGEDEKREITKIEPLTHPNPAKRPEPIKEPMPVPVTEPEYV